MVAFVAADASHQGSVSADAAVSLDHVRFRYPGAADDALSIDGFAVRNGDLLFVRGPSGSGKTTLLSLLAGVLVPTAGQACLHGRSWGALSLAQRDRLRADQVGYIFQQFNLLNYLSVLENVLMPCRFSKSRRERAGGSASAIADAAREMLGKMGLSGDLIDRSASRLSVGQQQRVAAARALIGRPELVIADEPTSALDESAREAFMSVLLEACAAANSTLIFVSHDSRLAPLFTSQIDLAEINRAKPPLDGIAA